MILEINKVHFPITTLGYGRRIGLWTQGCSIRCPGCVSKDTWNSDPQLAVSIAELVKSLAPWLPLADGITISGGEPFDQPGGLHALLVQLRAIFAGDFLIFSGYSRGALDERHPHILTLIDVLVTDPFEPSAGQTLALRGSDNQRVFLLTELARARYPGGIDRLAWNGKRSLDVVVDGDRVWMAGIPRPGDMARLRKQLALRGFACRSSDQSQTLVRA